MTTTVHRIRSMDSDEYLHLTRRNEHLEDANAHLRGLNTELEAENRNLRDQAADLEHGLGEQARLLGEETTARKRLEVRLDILEAQAIKQDHHFANIVSWLREERRKRMA